MHSPVKKGPRAAESYRGARRNAVKAARGLPEWRQTMAHHANRKAKLGERIELAQRAREAAAKAAAMPNQFGLPSHVVAAAAMLDIYESSGIRGRSISAVVRTLRGVL
jgi:transcription initiation factor TFIIIB Brf1 subunit/transcription initiation factor TFIIB